MGRDEEIQEHLELSDIYLETARLNVENELLEPALFNAIHALELSIKAVLLMRVSGPIITHNVGGLLGKQYRDELGEKNAGK